MKNIKTMLLLDADLTRIHPNRSGIIPYVKRNNHVYFLMGVDTNTGEWSDFAGGVKAYENALSGGLRECMEELRWIISFQDLGLIRQGILGVKAKQEICIMFAEVKEPTFFETARERFHKKCDSMRYHEMSDIVWIRDDEMLKYSRVTFRNSKIWTRIRAILSKCGSFNWNFIKRL